MEVIKKYFRLESLLALFTTSIIIVGCSSQKTITSVEQSKDSDSIVGTYYWYPDSKRVRYAHEYVKLNSDSTAEYSFMADIRVKKTGSWSIKNDTIYLNIHNNEKTFVRIDNNLTQLNGRVWTKK